MQVLLTGVHASRVAAIDETIPHPIDERGLLSRIAVNTTRLFRPVEIIEIKGSAVHRPDLTIEAGTVIVMENQDGVNHRLTLPPAPGNDVVTDVSSPVLKPGEMWGIQFLNTGTYPYHCTLHPDQEHGVIRVVVPETEKSGD